jgi:hypothetical protein
MRSWLNQEDEQEKLRNYEKKKKQTPAAIIGHKRTFPKLSVTIADNL